MIINYKKVLLCLSLSTTLFSPSAFAQNNEEIIKSIMKLRADVESLYTNIDKNKDYYRSQMKSFAMQSADSDAQINRETTAIKLAKTELAKLQLKAKSKSSENTELQPLLEYALNLLESSIKDSFPFKVQERLDSLEKIRTQMKDKSITNERALALLWASYDDNIRVTNEIGLFKQNIEIAGKKTLSQVAKIGSVMMFFSTPDNRVGYVAKSENIYTYKVITDPDDIKKIVNIFDALQKQIRTGFFDIPNALVLTENK